MSASRLCVRAIAPRGSRTPKLNCSGPQLQLCAFARRRDYNGFQLQLLRALCGDSDRLELLHGDGFSRIGAGMVAGEHCADDGEQGDGEDGDGDIVFAVEFGFPGCFL